MTTNERQQRMAERILEDETLRGDLEDDAATALIDWASQRAAAAAADPASSDADVEAQVQAIRQAARAAARSGETAPKRLIALAAARLDPSQELLSAEAPATTSSAPGQAEPAATDVAPAVNAAPAVADAPAPAGAASSTAAPSSGGIPPTPGTTPAAPASETLPQPAGAAGKRTRRKRSRLARFFKHVLGGR